MSIYDFITRTFNIAHNTIHAGMEASHAADMASIAAQYDNPGPHTSHGYESAEQKSQRITYEAQANLEAARIKAKGGKHG